MGSGLILLVIVGAWLAVLVPMGLRSSDSSAPSRSTERLGDAVRVLRRRSAAAAPEPAVPSSGEPPRAGGSRRVVASRRRSERYAAWLSAAWSTAWSQWGRVVAGSRRLLRARGTALARVAARRPVRERRDRRDRRSRAAVRVTPAQRRRRVLLVLLVLTGVTTLAGLLGPAALLVAAVGLAALTVLWLVRCRSVAARARRRRRALHERAAQLDAADRTVAVRIRRAPEPVPAAPPVPTVAADLSDQLVAVAEPAVHDQPAAYDEPRAPRRPAAGQEWEPVPVPLPMYVGKAVAPRAAAPPFPTRRPRVDLGSLDDPGAGVTEPQPTDEPRRAAGGW